MPMWDFLLLCCVVVVVALPSFFLPLWKSFGKTENRKLSPTHTRIQDSKPVHHQLGSYTEYLSNSHSIRLPYIIVALGCKCACTLAIAGWFIIHPIHGSIHNILHIFNVLKQSVRSLSLWLGLKVLKVFHGKSTAPEKKHWNIYAVGDRDRAGTASSSDCVETAQWKTQRKQHNCWK